jgi:LCP family protein required for cell wall assembly
MKPRRRTYLRRFLVGIDLVVLLMGGLIVTFARPAAGGPAIEIHKVDDAAFDPRPDVPFFVLVVGNDGRAGLEGRRGDALHIVGVNPGAGAISIVDIPRDTYVDIPGFGRDKITMAFDHGGLQLQLQTVSAMTGIPFTFALTTDFDGFQRLVDDMGGIDVHVPSRMYDPFSGADFQPGMNHMTGGAALSFARDRHDFFNGDLSRTVNQGWLMIAALAKARESATTPYDTVKLVATLARNVQYDGVSLPDLYRLSRLCLAIDPSTVRNVGMPATTGSAGAASVVFATAAADDLWNDLRDDAILQRH